MLFAGTALANAIAEAENVATSLTVVSCDGWSVPTIIAGDKPVTSRVWLDYLEPGDIEAHQTVRYLPRVVLTKVDAQLWQDELATVAAANGDQAAPLIDFTAFATQTDLETMIRQRNGRQTKTLERLHRKTERELGPVRYQPVDPDPTAFDDLITWKRLHYARTGVGDPFAVRENIELFRSLYRAGVLEIASLRAGNRLLAAIALVTLQGRTYYWMPSYDTEVAVLSPGNALLNWLIFHSYERGDHEFDFMLGNEGSKFHYATHVRVIGAVGSVPVARRIRRLAGEAKRKLLVATAGAEDS